MKYGALFGWGIALYSVMFTLWSLLSLYGFGGGVFARALLLAVLLGLSIIAGRALRLRRAADVLPYSIAWTLAVVLLDGLFSYPLTGFAVYTQWGVWFGYAIVLLAPLCAARWLPSKHFSQHS